MTDVSFIVPTRNTERTLRKCLESIRGQVDADVEAIVVDNFSTDATLRIADEVADVVTEYGPERSAQRNWGAKVARAEIIVFIDADMVLPPTVARDCLALLGPNGDPDVRAVVLPELAFGDGFFARCRSLEKRLYLGDTAVEAARAFRTDEFFDVGGYDESLTGPEDWELADRMLAAGGMLARAQDFIWHDEGRIDLLRAFAKKRYYGHGIAGYLQRAEASRRRTRRRGVLRRPRRLMRDPAATVGLAVLKTVEFSGAAVGIMETRAAGKSR